MEDFGGFVPLNALVVSADVSACPPDVFVRTNKNTTPTSEIADKASVTLESQDDVPFMMMPIDALNMFA